MPDPEDTHTDTDTGTRTGTAVGGPGERDPFTKPLAVLAVHDPAHATRPWIAGEPGARRMVSVPGGARPLSFAPDA
ncbi:hypothetical protein [Streptomyces sp. NPDC002855]|uniref:hypothetical protein n=1 Tax=Streptomyces sp. NPDC002855 TaxID=3154437 RepID=UPI00331BA2C4